MLLVQEYSGHVGWAGVDCTVNNPETALPIPRLAEKKQRYWKTAVKGVISLYNNYIIKKKHIQDLKISGIIVG